MNKMHLYYKEKGILPTHASLCNQSDFERYEGSRNNFYLHKLYLPPMLFKGKRLIEFGPDSGENSLVFASNSIQKRNYDDASKCLRGVRRMLRPSHSAMYLRAGGTEKEIKKWRVRRK